MFKKILSLGLMTMMLTLASNAPLYAQTGSLKANDEAVRAEKQTAKDLKKAFEAEEKKDTLEVSDKSTMAEYEKARRRGKGLSTTTKVLIGVGIAAAVVGILFVGKRDLENNLNGR